MVYGLYAISPVSMTSLVTVARAMQKHRHELGTSQGVPGPHDFAVRISTARQQNFRVHRIPRPTSVTIAKRPSCERGTAGMMIVIWGFGQLRQIGTTGNLRMARELPHANSPARRANSRRMG